MLTREPATPPSVPSRDGAATHLRHILFRHPAYDDSCNVLLKLFAPDLPSRGIHAEYALVACGIIAGNRWDGWFSQSKDGTTKIETSPDTILESPSYYFHLPLLMDDPISTYPIVPSFRDWHFPHDRLPPLWTISPPHNDVDRAFSTSGLMSALQQRDISCRMSGYIEGVQVAHICPQSEFEWYRRNGMSRYNAGNSSTVNDLSNTLLLRADLHIAFDNPKFLFVPKPCPDPQLPQKFVVHLVEQSRELEFLFHNRALQTLQVSVELLFARFAWTLFPWLDGFLTNGVPRRLIGINLVEEDLTEENVPSSFTSAKLCAQLTAKASQSRNASPKKRGRPETEVKDDVEIVPPLTSEILQTPKRRRQQPLLEHALSAENEPCGALDARTPSESPKDFIHITPSQNPSSPPYANESLAAQKQAWLEQERLRSDPQGIWKKEETWAAGVWNGSVAMGEAELKRWLEYNGGEIQHPWNET